MIFDWTPYEGREQTGVKHFILRAYLERFAPIIGSFADTITYVDCFCGPWRSESEKHDDTSFAIALKELKKARDFKANQGGAALKLRAFFVESSKIAFTDLKAFCDTRPVDGIEVALSNDELENQIGDIVKFVRAGGRKNFPFIFVDPTGWSGFSLKAITPLLRLEPCEVLLNFMTSHITRWVDHPAEEQRRAFEALYGTERYGRVIDRLRNKEASEREDILLSEYMDAIRSVGHFQHMSAAVVLAPGSDRTHFHLVYASRHPKGVEVFKGAEKKAMESMQEQRALVRDRKNDARDSEQGQLTLEMGARLPRHDDHYDQLREQHLRIARARVLRALKTARHGVEWSKLHAVALEVPLTFPADLKAWVKEWRTSGAAEVSGLNGRETTPKLDSRVIWRQPEDLSPFTISELLIEGRMARLVPALTISPELEEETGERLVASSKPFPFHLRGSSRDALKENFGGQLAAAIYLLSAGEGAGLSEGEKSLQLLLRQLVVLSG